MTGSDRDLEAALAEMADLAERARQDLGEHPAAAELVAYRAGELGAAAAARLQDHLVACAECADLLLDLNGFTGLGEERLASAAEVEAVVRGVEDRASRPPTGAAGPPRRRPPTGRFSRLPRGWPETLAASLLVATVGLAALVVQQRRAFDEATRPQVNAPVVELSTATLRSAADAPAVLELAPGIRHVTLVIGTSQRQRFPEYRLEIARADATPVVDERGLTRTEYGSLRMILSSRDLVPGDYLVRLFGVGERGDELLAEMPLRVIESASGP